MRSIHFGSPDDSTNAICSPGVNFYRSDSGVPDLSGNTATFNLTNNFKSANTDLTMTLSLLKGHNPDSPILNIYWNYRKPSFDFHFTPYEVPSQVVNVNRTNLANSTLRKLSDYVNFT